MKPYLVGVDEYRRWIDLEAVQGISPPYITHETGGSCSFQFSITLAFHESDRTFAGSIKQELDPNTHYAPDAPGLYMYGHLTAHHHPEAYVDQIKPYQDSWDALFKAWTQMLDERKTVESH